jgi:hypothetical protein
MGKASLERYNELIGETIACVRLETIFDITQTKTSISSI